MFNYIADLPWPTPNPQLDWVNHMHSVEHWLVTTIGAEHERWIWVKYNQPANTAIAFKHSKHKTLFLLQWA